jgi:hypothetical protein
MTLTRIALCALLLGLAARADAITAEELAAKNLEARGGTAALDAVQNVRRSGQLVVRGGQLVLGIVETRERPDSIRDDVSLQGLTQVEAYDGKAGWKIDPFGGRKDPERTPPEDMKGLIQDADIGGPLVSYQARGGKLEYLGTEDIDGTAAYKLKVTGKDGDVQYVYLDPDYFLEIRIESQRSVRGVKETTVTDLGEYEKVAGVYWPTAIATGRKGDRSPDRIQYEKVEVNLPLDKAVFAFPVTAKN